MKVESVEFFLQFCINTNNGWCDIILIQVLAESIVAHSDCILRSSILT